MPHYIRVAALENPVEAALLAEELEEREIPHAINHVEDSAFGGIFTLNRDWGGVDAPEEFRDEIVALLAELRSQQETTDETEPAP